MIRLVLTDGFFELDRMWVPERLFDFERDFSVERGADETRTIGLGDGFYKPNPIAFNISRGFSQRTMVYVFARDLQNVASKVTALEYHGISLPISKAYFTWTFGEAMNYITGRLELVPTEIGDWT